MDIKAILCLVAAWFSPFSFMRCTHLLRATWFEPFWSAGDILSAATEVWYVYCVQAFLLWDTFGFPLDLTQLMAEEQGLQVDAAGFEAAMEEAREKSRAAGKKSGVSALQHCHLH